MVNMDNDFDLLIQSEIQHYVKDIKPPEEMFDTIFSNANKKPEYKLSNPMFFKTCLAVILFFILSSSLILTISPHMRVMAMKIIKKVFVIDKNNNIIEKNAANIILYPAVCDGTNLSDKELSVKLGLNVHFPKTLCEDFSLINKLEGIGILSPINYDLWYTIKNDARLSIHSEEIYKDLTKYKPYRSACGIFQNSSGDITFGISISNKHISLFDNPLLRYNAHEEISLGNVQAIWDDVFYPDYTEGDMTKKPKGLETVKTLTFYFKGATYMITSIYDAKSLEKESAIKYAQAFLNSQN